MPIEYLKTVYGNEVKNLPRTKIAIPPRLRKFSYELVSVAGERIVLVSGEGFDEYAEIKSLIEEFFDAEAVAVIDEETKKLEIFSERETPYIIVEKECNI